ncbi:hypothetical protein RQM47_06790 [Rubrivirga sp. S365]|uniref:Membrane-bound lysozyme-inhibitor of c-type lysozyme n=1 Tax=Rubrivirga litoralis TaxID=3075598 RepID=A0ABU3BSK4_9BACT|nr:MULTISPECIES: hypothetical protein [unclassified Rubrivirga]MDT0632274.1 hypothetical protein [Rubrivirga sp. F394]MDT7856341.1 hypothetical protein [Rubrivirga sp. S365]
MPRPALALLLGLAACAGAARLDRADLVGTTWRETCADPEIVDAYVRLDADGGVAWSYERPDSVRAERVHTWAVEDGALVLRWNEGGAATRYVRAGREAGPGRLVGRESTLCPDGAVLERVGP